MTISNTSGYMPVRSIDLATEDQRWVTYRERTPLPRPEPKSFDQKKTAARLSKIKAGRYPGWGWDWASVRITVSLTPEEAHFWFAAMTPPQWTQAKDLAAELARRSFDGRVTLGDARSRVANSKMVITPEMLLPLSNLLSLEDMLWLILEDNKLLAHIATAETGARCVHPSQTPLQRVRRKLDTLAVGFRTYILPYLTEQEVAQVKDQLRLVIGSSIWPSDYDHTPPTVFRLAAALGMHDEVYAVVIGWPDGFYRATNRVLDLYHRPQEIVFGLASPELVISEMRRLGLYLRNKTQIRAWLALTEYAALDLVRDSILEKRVEKKAAPLLKTFAIVQAPEAAPHMLALALSSKAPRIAREWLNTHPEHAITGLIPVAAAGDELAEAALDFLIGAKRKGYEPLIRTCLEQVSAEVTEVVRARVLGTEVGAPAPFDETTTPAWLAESLPDAETIAEETPGWVEVTRLPPVVVDKCRLNDMQVAGLLVILQQSDLDHTPPPLITGLKEHANSDTLDGFAWELFQMWLRDDMPSKDRWAMVSLGMLGNDNSALKLVPFIRKWPSKNRFEPAVRGLACLRAIGTDTALMQINAIAQKVKSKALKAKAREAMEAIAQERNMTREQLEDRVVPDCGLNECGSRAFDFGPRQFSFVLSPEMKPMVRDDRGKLRANLPKPGVKDDAKLANQAVADWKLLKKQLREAVKVQAVRLEQTMVTGRRWTVEEFETLLVRHPLMINLVCRLIWGSYNRSGQLAVLFRVTKDQTYADIEGKEVLLTGIQEVCLVHPLYLSDELGAAWEKLLSDHEIVSPFPQIGREIYRLQNAELEAREITRFTSVRVPAVSLVSTLERLGWARGIPEDAGVFHEHSKPFYAANATAIVQYDGVQVKRMVHWKDQAVKRCFFVPGIYTPVIYMRHQEKLRLSQVDLVAISEVLRDLNTVTAKGKQEAETTDATPQQTQADAAASGTLESD
jgi:hypothetical protein